MPNYIETICKKHVLKNADCTTLKNHLNALEKQRILRNTVESNGCHIATYEGTLCLLNETDLEDDVNLFNQTFENTLCNPEQFDEINCMYFKNFE